MKLFKHFTSFFLASLLLFFVFSLPAYADNLQDAFSGKLNDAASGMGYKPADSDTAGAMLGQVITSALSFVGVIFLVLMIYAGFLWMTASGKEEQVTKAKKIIGAAIIGLVIVLLAYAITFFILQNIGSHTLQKV